MASCYSLTSSRNVNAAGNDILPYFGSKCEFCCVFCCAGHGSGELRLEPDPKPKFKPEYKCKPELEPEPESYLHIRDFKCKLHSLVSRA